MISINATLLVQVLNFLILLFILNHLLFRPILRVMRERSEYMEKTRQEIREIEQKTEEGFRDYQSQGVQAKEKASEARLALNHEGNAKAEEILGLAKEEIMTIKKSVSRQIEEEMEKARHYLSLNRDAEHLSYEITEKVVGRRF